MRLLHATPTVNAPMILSSGLDPHMSECQREEIWLCTPSLKRWAMRHVQARHHQRHIAVMEVEVPRSWLTRRRKRIWTCELPISLERIRLWEVRNG
jgi:hypothetical protein